uniref:NADH-ubiquinone oxidoreductase chain 5 n=1 Tax=Glossobalanus marginatus TaxID=1443200 RepID=A0A3Q8HFI5_9BILA|nr:NADH dehydrogenase subunit 5 [Glossobalanus marginatus]AXZ97170.1 NADH dehydrogenase subunit 5 [Glossobalanus marginatus]
MTLSVPLIILTCFTTTLILLTIGIIAPNTHIVNTTSKTLKPINTVFTMGHSITHLNHTTHIISNSTITTTSLTKWAFIISTIPTLILLSNHLSISSTNWSWLSIDAFSLSVSFRYDIYSILFSSIALFITWSILEFSQYYMSSDPMATTFFRLLTVFLLAMIILISANTLFQLLIGWEGVGFLSFLLIGWWFTRSDANTAALQAIIYNRLGDIGILLAAGWMILTTSTWTLDSLFILTQSSPTIVSLFIIGCLIAATGKSAQFGLHPWLPAAMEGPTPVSALLHSSTMVVAGVFLLIRISPLISNSPFLQNVILVLGAITALFAASTATVQHDIKKIIAFSTTSQLGLMTYAVGLGLPLLAFFHICTHGFFKAMLFLCSGSTIHSTSNEQDIRKMGGLTTSLPTTAACLTLGSLALFGTPFLAGFYSKDLILESASASFTGLITLTLVIVATALTATYSARILLATSSQNGTLSSVNPLSEDLSTLTNPLKRLAGGTTIAGWALLPLLLTPEPISPIPLWVKTLALTITIASLVYATAALTTINSPQSQDTTKPLSHIRGFFTNFWYFPEVFHYTNPAASFLISSPLTTRLFDQGWGEQTGGQGLGQLNSYLSTQVQNIQSGLIKQYITIALCSLFLALIILITLTY